MNLSETLSFHKGKQTKKNFSKWKLWPPLLRALLVAFQWEQLLQGSSAKPILLRPPFFGVVLRLPWIDEFFGCLGSFCFRFVGSMVILKMFIWLWECKPVIWGCFCEFHMVQLLLGHEPLDAQDKSKHKNTRSLRFNQQESRARLVNTRNTTLKSMITLTQVIS